MTRTAFLSVLLVVLGTAGCMSQRQPQLRNGLLTPPELIPGNSGVISVEVKDPYGIVARLEGAVKQSPALTFILGDDGVMVECDDGVERGDVQAGDGTWSKVVDAPFYAPPGDYELDVTAYNPSGEILMVRDAEGNPVPLSITIPVRIVAPAPEATPPPAE